MSAWGWGLHLGVKKKFCRNWQTPGSVAHPSGMVGQSLTARTSLDPSEREYLFETIMLFSPQWSMQSRSYLSLLLHREEPDPGWWKGITDNSKVRWERVKMSKDAPLVDMFLEACQWCSSSSIVVINNTWEPWKYMGITSLHYPLLSCSKRAFLQIVRSMGGSCSFNHG